MLRPICKITITPKAKDVSSTANPATVKSTQLLNALANPLEEERKVVVFQFTTEFETYASFEDLTSTAKITLPHKLKTLEGREIATSTNAYFRRGDTIKIEAGYSPNLRVVYEGYISRVYFHTPIVIECQDEMYRLMHKHIIYPKMLSYNYTDARGKQLKRPRVQVTTIKLQELLHDVFLNDDNLRDIQRNFECVDTTVYIKDRFDSSVAECLQKIKSEYGLQSYFRDKKLHVGFESDAKNGNSVEFKFEENIIEDNDLNYQLSDDIILKVRVESIETKTNKRETIEVGEDFGEHRDYKIMNATKDQMRIFAQDKLNALRYTGYHGSFLTFGEPFVKPGDIAQLSSKRYPERNGSYQIKSVRRTFGAGGYRQQIEIGARLTF